MKNGDGIRASIEAALPTGWRLDSLDTRRGSFKVVCPIGDRFGVRLETFLRTIRGIEKAAGARYDGGGAMVGGDEYDCFFFLGRRRGDENVAAEAARREGAP